MKKTLAALAMLLLACTGAQQLTTSASEPPSSTTATTPTSSTSHMTSTTTTTTLVEEIWREPLEETLPTLGDGRPATFLAVNDDRAAVEVDTSTGEVIRLIAQVATRNEYEEDPGRNVVDSVWRIGDGSAALVSECCEPASGQMYWVRPGEQVTSEDNPLLPESYATSGWLAAPSPTTRSVAISGTFVGIDSPERGQLWAWSPSSSVFYASTPPAWSFDLSTLWVLGGEGSAELLWTIEPAPSTISSTELPWLSEGQYLSGLGTQASGRLVTFRLTRDGDDEFGNDFVRGIVFEPTGELVAEFDVEPGSRMGGYDPSGRFLIYVDGEGTVRWQGLGQTGSLGEGYSFASW
jgi:hypothetical protein